VVKVYDKEKIISFLKHKELENSAIIGILSNEPQCEIFADDLKNPNGILVKDKYFTYIYSANNNFLNTLFKSPFLKGYQGFAAVNEDVFNYMNNMFNYEWKSKCYVYYLNKESILMNDGMLLDKIHINDAEKINELYTYKDQDGLNYIQESIKKRPSSALYLNDILISSAMIHNNNSIGVLYTSKEYRNIGYGKKVTLDLCRKLVARGINPVAYITEDNLPAIKLFESCGFKKLGLAYWFGISNDKTN